MFLMMYNYRLQVIYNAMRAAKYSKYLMDVIGTDGMYFTYSKD